MNDHVFVIAEMSANHCGDLDLAKKIIAAAKDAGADAVKIQTYTSDTITLNCHNPESRISGGTLWDDMVLGKVASQDLSFGTPLSLSHLA